MTDHGSQFCSDEEKDFKFSETLKKMGVEHIMAKVKRPQSNGKEERWFGTIKKLYHHFGKDIDKAVTCYNSMFHLSLDTCPAEAYQKKKRNS
jgi:putative transposase